jgi:hypothetical protein
MIDSAFPRVETVKTRGLKSKALIKKNLFFKKEYKKILFNQEQFLASALE